MVNYFYASVLFGGLDPIFGIALSAAVAEIGLVSLFLDLSFACAHCRHHITQLSDNHDHRLLQSLLSSS